MEYKLKPLKIAKTGIYRCQVCGGAGTAQTIHCGTLMEFEPPNKVEPKEQGKSREK